MKTERGFSIFNFRDRNDQNCSLQKSSLAFEDAIWLGVADANPEIMASDAVKLGLVDSETESNGWIPFIVPDEVLFHTRMHLTKDQVEILIPMLQKFVQTGDFLTPSNENKKLKRYIFTRGLCISGNWVYGSLTHDEDLCHIFTREQGEYQIDPETIGQYIGMEDMKTVAIYEGDIVRDYITGCLFEVVFTECGNFGLKSSDPGMENYHYQILDPIYVANNLRIVGNVHESNPNKASK